MDNDKYEFTSYSRPPQKRRGILSYFIVALVAAIIGGFIAAYVAPNYLYGKVIPMPDMFKHQEVVDNNNGKIEIVPNSDITPVSAVAKKGMGSVVGITTVVVEREWIWERPKEGVGSGVIVDSNGYILTNSHVIGDGKAESINVLFESGEKVEGKVLWFDDSLDLAIVKADVVGVQAAELGDSDELEVGELSVAIGNPLGLDFQRSVTSGVISGLHRSIRVDNVNVIEDLIQTDASINPGNSGGPLLNAKGEVIGINTAKIQSGEGLGFSIPINMVKPIVSEVIEKGTFQNVYLGFAGREVELYERQLGVETGVDYGIVMVELVPNGPAAVAGAKPGDIIIGIDDKKVESMIGLRKILYKYRQGDTGVLKVIRSGKEIELEIKFFDF